jgi:preprotein translocase subunit SecG
MFVIFSISLICSVLAQQSNSTSSMARETQTTTRDNHACAPAMIAALSEFASCSTASTTVDALCKCTMTLFWLADARDDCSSGNDLRQVANNIAVASCDWNRCAGWCSSGVRLKQTWSLSIVLIVLCIVLALLAIAGAVQWHRGWRFMRMRTATEPTATTAPSV